MRSFISITKLALVHPSKWEDDRKQYICDPRPPAYKRLGGA
jgi:hypothetical protein